MKRTIFCFTSLAICAGPAFVAFGQGRSWEDQARILDVTHAEEHAQQAYDGIERQHNDNLSALAGAAALDLLTEGVGSKPPPK
jgi:hypothetical protein